MQSVSGPPIITGSFKYFYIRQIFRTSFNHNLKGYRRSLGGGKITQVYKLYILHVFFIPCLLQQRTIVLIHCQRNGISGCWSDSCKWVSANLEYSYLCVLYCPVRIVYSATILIKNLPENCYLKSGQILTSNLSLSFLGFNF